MLIFMLSFMLIYSFKGNQTSFPRPTCLLPQNYDTPSLGHERQHRSPLTQQVLVQLPFNRRPADGPHPNSVGQSPCEHLEEGR